MDWIRVYIALGGNLGDRAATIEKALRRLDEHASIRVIQRSRLYETKPVGGPPDQPYYLNAAAALDTVLPADELLREMLDLEIELGRRRTEQWGPRTIDMDLLLYGDQVFNEPELTVPHRHMHERGFVLAPLVEIAPDARHPIYEMTVAALLQSLEGLRPINDSPKDKPDW